MQRLGQAVRTHLEPDSDGYSLADHVVNRLTARHARMIGKDAEKRQCLADPDAVEQ